MNASRIRSIVWFLAIGWLMLLMTACVAIEGPAVAVQPAPVTPVRLGTTLLTAQTAGNMFAVAWSPNGKYLALGGAAGIVQVRDAGTGNVLFTLHDHAD